MDMTDDSIKEEKDEFLGANEEYKFDDLYKKNKKIG